MLLEQLDAAPDWRCLDTSLSRYEYLWTRTWLYRYSPATCSRLYCFPLHYDIRTGVVIASPGFVTSGHSQLADRETKARGIQHLQAQR